MEFDAPVGYKEPEKKPKPHEEEMTVDPAHFAHNDENTFFAFKGEGNRLDGKKIKDTTKVEPPAHILKKYSRGIPDYDHNIFELKFDRSIRPKETSNPDKDQNQFKTFQGEGQSLRPRKQ